MLTMPADNIEAIPSLTPPAMLPPVTVVSSNCNVLLVHMLNAGQGGTRILRKRMVVHLKGMLARGS